MEIKLYKNDIPDDVDLGKVIAIDTETLGLNLVRDRLCLVQMSSGDGCAHLVQFESGEQDSYSAPNLKAILKAGKWASNSVFAMVPSKSQ